MWALSAAWPARAHDLWIEPSTFHPAPGAPVGIRLRVGQHFVGDPLPRYGSLVLRFDLTSGDGERSIEGDEGDEPAGRITIPSAGAHLVGYRSNNSYVSQEPQKFVEYLKEEGLEQIILLRAGRGESQKPSREFFARCAKALLFAGSAPHTGFDRVLGFTLEIVPEKDPEAWQPGGDLVFRLIYEGRPLADALLVAMPQSEPSKKLDDALGPEWPGRFSPASRRRVAGQGRADDPVCRRESRLAEPLGFLNIRDPGSGLDKRRPMTKRRIGRDRILAGLLLLSCAACRKGGADLEDAGLGSQGPGGVAGTG